MTHTNAYLTPRGRLALAELVVEAGWSLRRAAERFQCSPATAKKWVDRYLAGCQVPSFVEAERVFNSQAAEAAGGCA